MSRSPIRALLPGIIVLYLLAGASLFIGYLPAVAAFLIVAVVVAGFFLVPDRDCWVVWTTQYKVVVGEEHDFDLIATQEPVAIKAHVRRLWMLWLPTAIAVAILVVLASGGVWPAEFILLVPLLGTNLGYLVVAAVWLLVANWIFERWTLARAEAAPLQGVTHDEVRVFAYYFTVKNEYYGGWHMRLLPYESEPVLRQIVMYRRVRPLSNRVAAGFVFHRFEIVARGVQDLEHARLRTRGEFVTEPQ